MISISNFFYKKSSLLIASIVTIVVFGYLFLVMMDAGKCFEIADSTQKSLGTSFGLTTEMIQGFFSIRSKEMIVCYKEFNLIWDNIFGLLYGLMYIFWVSLLFKPYATKVKWLNLFPVLQVLFDWLENAEVVQLANSFLLGEPLAASNMQLVSIFSMGKWIGSSLVFLIIIVGIVWRIRDFIKNKRSANS
jgi:hypothetical protein